MTTAKDSCPWDKLTETQKRRLRLRLRGYSYRHIARLECVSVTSVWDSLLGCAKKLPSLRTILYENGIA
jgi:DNA-binding CsgD family transcriptional regulator